MGDLPSLSADQAEILAYALRRLRYKLEYSAVGFQLLPEEFTLSQLQKTKEIVLGETLDKCISTGASSQPGSSIFRYRPDAVAEVKTRRLFP